MEQALRIANAWKKLDLSTSTSEYEEAWKLIEETDRRATPEEREVAKSIVSNAPWMKKRK